MTKKLDRIKLYYESNMGKDLPDHSLLGWESEEAQVLRFDAVTSNVAIHGKRVLDVGCGLGNFVEYLHKKGVKADYTGVDILHSMICHAEKKNLDARFIHCDVFKDNPFKEEDFDIVYSSGIFNLNLKNNMEFLKDAVETFLSLSRSIVAFNLLSNSSMDKEDKYFYYDMEEIRDMLEAEFPGQLKGIRLIDGYLHNDFTVICTKRKQKKT